MGARNQLTFRWRVNASNVVELDERVTATTVAEGNGSNVTTGFLTIKNTRYSDNGRYYCRVTNYGRADAVESGVANQKILCETEYAVLVVDVAVVKCFELFVNILGGGNLRGGRGGGSMD